MSASASVYGVEYIGPEYQITSEVLSFHNVYRFSRSSDITDVFSSDPDAQASYTAGLIVLLVFSITFFTFWGVAILTFKCMGQGNAGFLSGYPFIVEQSPNKRRYSRPTIVRATFLVVTILLWIFAILLVAKGVTKLDDTADTAEDTLVVLNSKIQSANDIVGEIRESGTRSVKIRDKVVELFGTIQCNNLSGIDLYGLGKEATDDLNDLSGFIYEYASALINGITLSKGLSDSAEKVFAEVNLSGLPLFIMSGALFVLPAFFVVGVGLAMMEIRLPKFQMMLTYIILPTFTTVVLIAVVLCSVLLPLGAANSDICVGSASNQGGPDDTVLTAYRNLLGAGSSIPFMVVMYYTQRCVDEYYPFDFLSTYLDQLKTAQSSIDTLIRTLDGNLGYVQQECGTDELTTFLILSKSMKKNLDLLKSTVDDLLMLVNCEDINKMYTNAVHDAGCTKAPAAMSWVYGSLMVISVCGMIIITLRAAYLPSIKLMDPAIKRKDTRTSQTQHLESVSEDDRRAVVKLRLTQENLDNHDAIEFRSEPPVVHRHPVYVNEVTSPPILSPDVVVHRHPYTNAPDVAIHRHPHYASMGEQADVVVPSHPSYVDVMYDDDVSAITHQIER